MRRTAWLANIAALGLTACATDRVDREGVDEDGAAVTAELREADGRPVGSASATQNGDSLRVRIVATGLPAGAHGVHLHSVGACEAPGFTSAGPHWNPAERLHGTQNPQGPHLGDLPNLLVGTDGRGTLEFVIANARIGRGDRALLDGDGTAAVVHAAADDQRTDPSGNSGARIACGVLRATG